MPDHRMRPLPPPSAGISTKPATSEQFRSASMTCRPRCGRLRVRQHGSVSCWWSLLGGRPHVGHEAAAVHHAARRCGSDLAARGTRTAEPQTNRLSWHLLAAVAETNQDLKSLIGAVSAFQGPGFLLPTRKPRGFRVVPRERAEARHADDVNEHRPLQQAGGCVVALNPVMK